MKYSKEHKIFLRECARFAEKNIAPGLLDADKFRDRAWLCEIYKKSAALEIAGLVVPQDCGGAGESLLLAGLVTESFARVCASAGAMLACHFSACFALASSPDSCARELLCDLASGKISGPAVFLFPAAPVSSWPALQKNGDAKLVCGRAPVVPGALQAGLFVIALPGEDGPALAAVFPGEPGVAPGEDCKLPGLNALPHAEIVFNGALVKEKHLLADPKKAVNAVDEGKRAFYCLTAAVSCGLAASAANQAFEHAKGRYQFGRMLIEHSEIARMTGMMRLKQSAGRAAWEAVAQNEAGNLADALYAKAFCADSALETAGDALQIMGGYGYMHEYGMEKRMRDAKTLQLEGGSTPYLVQEGISPQHP
ncbi:MAG: acyl-CoA dehydrogenase family protein [Desulfatibacillaceae bacterium]|nr:acyl-CoA dehydrogenase family protein [Desulfatibacillaceae bacterium]